MTFEIIKKDRYSLVKVLVDKLDTNNAHDLKSELVMLSGNGEKNIVLDMSACKFCDSSGLRAVLLPTGCVKILWVLLSYFASPDVEHLVRISMLHTVLLITNSVEEAEELLEKKEKL